jgi:hypothetical protein
MTMLYPEAIPMLFRIEISFSGWLISRSQTTILSLTYPPRLSGLDREAQPWWVFFARLFVWVPK